MKKTWVMLTFFTVVHVGLMAQTKMIAHRGSWKNTEVPQNSLAALNKAIEQKAWGSEFDVHLTKDDVLVVNHDQDFYGIDIATSTYAELLAKKHPNGENIPTAEEYLKEGLKQRKTKLIYELKTNKLGTERTLKAVELSVDLVKKLKAAKQVEYIAFSYDACLKFKELDKKAKVHYLNGDKSPQEIKEAGLTGLDYNLSVFKKHPSWIKEAKKLGLKTNAWTVNREDDMRYFIEQGIDYITTDEPELWNRLFFLVSTNVFSQEQDSLAVVSKAWEETKLRKGVVWKQGHFDNLFGSQQEVNYVEIDLKKNLKKLRLAAESSDLRLSSELALENNALVAINGGFFDMKNGGAVDFIQVDNNVINRTNEKTDRGSALLLFSKKELNIKAATDTLYEADNYPNVMLSGPLLVANGNPHALSKNAFNDNRHPRTAVALTSDNKLLLFVVDGRNKSAQGMNLTELSKTLQWLGAQDAMNLDGGGSSTLYVKEATDNGVVNYPSDNKEFNHEGERPVANIIYIK